MTADTKSVPITRAATEKPETAMVPTEPDWEPLLSLRREIDRFFDDMPWRPGPLSQMRPWTRGPALPAADIVEKDGDFVMTLDVPGMSEKDIAVKLSDNAVTIRGEKTEEKQEEKEDYRLSERRHGSFVRTFGLPDSVDADKISATYDKGVLKLVMPKSDSAKRKQRTIEVKAA